MSKKYPLNKVQRKAIEIEQYYEKQRVDYEIPESVPEAQYPVQTEFQFTNTPESKDPRTIDVVCTATRRPAIIEQTFKSFSERLFKRYPTRLIINVDPVGENVHPSTIEHIGKKYFGDVIINRPSTPSFFKAFKWVFTNCTSKYIFHLQDDWLLTRDRNILEMIRYLDTYPDLACVRLQFNGKVEGTVLNDKMMTGTKYYDHPALWKRQFYNEIMPFYLDNYGTEFQLRAMCPENKANINTVLKRWHFGVYHEGGSSIRDIGREWLQTAGITQVYDKTGRYLTGWNKSQ